MKYRHYSKELINEAKILYDKGYTPYYINKQFNLVRGTVQYWVKKQFNIRPNNVYDYDNNHKIIFDPIKYLNSELMQKNILIFTCCVFIRWLYITD